MKTIYQILPSRLIPIIKKAEDGTLEQIRLKKDTALVITKNSKSFFVNINGFECNENSAIRVFDDDVEESFSKLCRFSVYTHEEELKQGFITTSEGHRVGITGTAVIKNGEITSMKNISGLCIRVSRQVFGFAKNYANSLQNTLVISAPGGGKTTFLRDMAREYSMQNIRTCIIDERGELAGVCCGKATFDLGEFCDVLDMYPKGLGTLQAVRTLSPQIIVLDEISSENEVKSVMDGANSGVCFIMSAHASCVDELYNKKALKPLFEGFIKRIIVLTDHMVTDVKKIEGGCIKSENGRSDFNSGIERVCGII